MKHAAFFSSPFKHPARRGCVAALMVVSRQSRSHEGIARRPNVLFLLLLFAAVRACNGRASVENGIGVAATTSEPGAAAAGTQPKTSINNSEASAATSSTAPALPHKERSTTIEGRKVDLSFSHIGYGGPITDLPAAIELSPSTVLLSDDGDHQQQRQHESDARRHDDGSVAGSPLALGLRECSLGDEGVAELARSQWVSGSLGVTALSLRNNQVRVVTKCLLV